MNGKYYGRLEVRYHKKEAARLEHIKNKRKRSKTMVKGYKVFAPDWTCKGKQYTCPGTFEEDVNPSVCNVGMHFCKNAADCFRYYDFDPNNHVAEVIAHGTVAEGEDKCATNKLEIVREIPWAEVLEIVNTGKACTGTAATGTAATATAATATAATATAATGTAATATAATGTAATGTAATATAATGTAATGTAATATAATGTAATATAATGTAATGTKHPFPMAVSIRYRPKSICSTSPLTGRLSSGLTAAPGIC